MKRRSRLEVCMAGIVVTFFLFCCNAEGANWYRVGEAKGKSQEFVDIDSIKKIEGHIVNAWTRELFARPQMIGDEKLIEITSHTEFKCGHNQFRPTEVIYSYQSGKTERITSEGMKSWKTINKDSTRILYEYLCKGKR